MRVRHSGRVRRSRRRLQRAAFVSILLLAAAGGGYLYVRSEPDTDAHMARAREYVEAGNPHAAVIELKNALQIAPDNAEARWILGQTYLALGDGSSATKEIETARELGLTSPETQDALLRAMLLQGRFSEVLGQLIVTTEDAETTETSLLQGQAHLGLGNLQKAREAFEQAARGEPDNPEASKGLARIALAQNELQEAKDQIELSISAAGSDPEAWLLRGEAALGERDFEAARHAFEQALRYSSNPTLAHIGLARTALAQDRLEDASGHIDALAALAPNSPLPQYLRAIAARQKGELDKAQELLREVLRVAPNHGPSLLLSGSIHYMKRELEQAEELLSRYLNFAPTNLAAVKLSAAIHIRQKELDDAIFRLLPAVEQAPDDAQLLALLGSAYMAKQEFTKASEYLEKAVALQPDAAAIKTQLALSHLVSGETSKGMDELRSAVELDPESSRADYLLALMHLRRKEFDDAREVIQRLLSAQPDNPIPLNLLGATYEGLGDPDRARQQYQAALALNAEYVSAALNLARLDWQAKDAESAKRRYQEILDDQPGSSPALIALAEIAREEGRSLEAIELLERGHRANPENVDIRLALLGRYLGNAMAAKALDLAIGTRALAPEDPRSELLLGQAQLAAGRFEDAVHTLDRFVERFPDVLAARYQLGVAQARSGDIPGARDSLSRVVELEPGNAQALLTLGQLEIAAGDIPRAIEVASRLQSDHPALPAGLILAGDAQAASGAPDAAIDLYHQALEIQPQTELVIKVARLRESMGSSEQARAELKDWLGLHPEDTVARLTLASSLHTAGDTDEAARHYEQVLEAEPGSIVALNNLAWLYHQDKDPRAVALAQQAYELVPDRPEIADTYGWVLVETGKVEQGISLLEKAVTQAPDNRDIRYHWAAGLAKAGDGAVALEELRDILGTPDAFSERAAAQALLDELSK